MVLLGFIMKNKNKAREKMAIRKCFFQKKTATGWKGEVENCIWFVNVSDTTNVSTDWETVI